MSSNMDEAATPQEIERHRDGHTFAAIVELMEEYAECDDPKERARLAYQIVTWLTPGLILFPAQCSEVDLTCAQGALLDMNWDAVECFSARLAELYRLTRPQVAALLGVDGPVT